MAEARETWFQRRDLYLLRNHPYFWCKGGFRPVLLSLAWLLLTFLVAVAFPIWQSFIFPDIFFVGGVLFVSFLVAGVLTLVVIPFATTAGMLPGPLYGWPAGELLPVSLSQKAWSSVQLALTAGIVIVSLRLPYDVMMWRVGHLVEMPALVDDLNAINAGLAACSVKYPKSEASLNRRPLPMSSSDIDNLRILDHRFIDPRERERVELSDDQYDRLIKELERALRKYALFKAAPEEPDMGYFRRNINDLDVALVQDNRSPAERICSQVALRDIRTVDQQVSRILEAQRFGVQPGTTAISVGVYVLAAVACTVSFAGVGMCLEGTICATLMYVVLFLLSLAREYFDVRIPEMVFHLLPFLLSIRGWRWIAHTNSPWPKDGLRAVNPSLAAAFPGALSLCHVWGGPTALGGGFDWLFVLLAMIPFWLLSRRLRHATLKREAEPNL
jgi:hypothetical protein